MEYTQQEIKTDRKKRNRMLSFNSILLFWFILQFPVIAMQVHLLEEY